MRPCRLTRDSEELPRTEIEEVIWQGYQALSEFLFLCSQRRERGPPRYPC